MMSTLRFTPFPLPFDLSGDLLSTCAGTGGSARPDGAIRALRSVADGTGPTRPTSGEIGLEIGVGELPDHLDGAVESTHHDRGLGDPVEP